MEVSDTEGESDEATGVVAKKPTFKLREYVFSTLLWFSGLLVICSDSGLAGLGQNARSLKGKSSTKSAPHSASNDKEEM